MPWPSFQEQNLIAEKLTAFDAQQITEERELKKLKMIKSGLQDDLLTGRVRVPETLMDGAIGI